jgi:hypothetical protein
MLVRGLIGQEKFRAFKQELRFDTSKVGAAYVPRVPVAGKPTVALM